MEGHEELITVHERSWQRTHIRAPIHGPLPRQPWSICTYFGEVITEGTNSSISPMNAFLTMFPMHHLNKILELTNKELVQNNFLTTTASEILKLLGVLILITRCEFSSRRDLWKRDSDRSSLLPSARLGRFISRDRFEVLLRHLNFSSKSVQGRDAWSPVEEFLVAINRSREERMSPCEFICVDESISRWYGLGGDWCGEGLPHYVSIERKPESGCEIKSSCCGRSGIMLRMELVTGKETGESMDFSECFKHSTSVTMRLVQPWLLSNRAVFADSWFSSVETACALLNQKTKYIGIVKTATREYPIAQMQ